MEKEVEGGVHMRALYALFIWVIGKLFQGSRVPYCRMCVYLCVHVFSWGKGKEGVGNRTREKRAKGQEGKPPAEERKALGPEKMKEGGFDNFLQSPSKKVEVSRKTHAITHSLYLEVSIQYQRSFSVLLVLWGTSFFFFLFNYDVSFILTLTQEARV